MQACDRCHARKTRCDRRIPQCGACEKAGTPCLHADKLRQRNIPRGYIDSMESMVQQLKEENRQLRRTLAARPRSSGCESVPSAMLQSPASTTTVGIAGPPTQPLATSMDMDDTGNNADTSPNASSSYPDTSVDGGGVGRSSLSSKGSPTDNAFTLEVGYLSLIATGETRYLGSSSGIGLASIIGTMVDARSASKFPSLDPGTPDSSRIRPEAPLPSDTTFPPLAVATPFIEAYFEHTHVTFPLLHRPSFMAMLGKLYNEPGYYGANCWDAFVFNMVLAIGASNFNRFDEPTADASKFYNMAQTKLKSVMEIDRLTALKAILLICQHGIFSNLRDTSASIWHLLGIGARICFELGLHIEQRQVNPSSQATVVTLEEEMRRRCFWCLYNLDRIVSSTLGRPVAIRDEEIDISLPSHLDDDCFGPDWPIIVDRQVGTEATKKSSPFLHLIRIRRLSGQVLSLFYNSRHLSRVPIEEKRQIRRKFQNEINVWRQDTHELALSQEPDSHRHISSFLTPEWYNAVYNNAILLLFRPSPYLPHPTMVADSEDGEPDLIKLLNAAKGSIESYSELHRKRRLNYSWITLHGVFVAGLAYVYSIGRILRDPTMRDLIPDFLCIIELTRACSNILVAICERWSVSRRSCELFNRLSNALIRDALNVAKQDNMRRPRMGDASFAGPASDNIPSQQLTPPNFTQMNEEIGHSGPPLEDGSLGSMPELDNILVMDEFSQFAGSFDIPSQREGSFPSELVSGFSQDWPFDIPLNSRGDFDHPMETMSPIW